MFLKEGYMKKIKFLFLTSTFVSSVCLVINLIFNIKDLARRLCALAQYETATMLPNYIAHHICSLSLLVISIILSITCFVICLISLIKGTNILNFTRLTYEEYKELREKKKQEKQDKKAQKLQAELEKIKSTK